MWYKIRGDQLSSNPEINSSVIVLTLIKIVR